MNQAVTAIFEDGIIKPDQPLHFPEGARVRVIVEELKTVAPSDDKAWEEFDQLSDQLTLDSGGVRMTRDQLHERD
jgi:predicted DNA-binding antitoxin AbrB/MazE fold protein